MMESRTAGRSPGRARVAIGLLVVIAAVLGVMAWWTWPRRDAPLAADWEALVTVLAGNGQAGFRDGDAAVARFSDPFGVAVAPDGTIYIADAGDSQRIRRISPQGMVSTVAGGARGFADGASGFARFDTPSGVAIAANGDLYVADTGNHAVRRITVDGVVSTVAGNGTPGYADGFGADARFNGPIGIAVDAVGRVIVADTYNDRIRAIAPDGRVETIAGGDVPGAIDGSGADARFDTPCGVAIDAAGRIFVADTGNGAVRVISPGGSVGTIAPPYFDGILRPVAIAVGSTGAVYVTDDRGRIAEIQTGGAVRMLAGSRSGFADGSGNEARFRGITGLAWTAPGRLVAVDSRNALVRLVAARSAMELRPPLPPFDAPRFDRDAFLSPPVVWPLAPMAGPFEITGTLGEPRGGDGSERFHAGVDVRAGEGTFVTASRDGVVTDPVATGSFGSLNESLRVGSLAYVHIRVGRTRTGEPIDASRFVATYDDEGRVTKVRVRRGTRFAAGEVIGTANPFNHVHLNVGWPGEEHNPLHFRLTQFKDTVPPTIPRGGVRLFGEDGEPFSEKRKGRLLVSGRVQIVVDAWDQVDGNEARRRLGLYRLGYQVLNRDKSPTAAYPQPVETIRFDRISPGADPRMVFASGSGIPFYGRRSTRMLYVVTNRLMDGETATGMWDTSLLSPGDYILRVLAADIKGNEAVANRDVAITIAAQQ